MKYQNFPVFQEEKGILTEVDYDFRDTELYVMKRYCSAPYVEFPTVFGDEKIYHCVTGFNSWSHKIVISNKSKEEIFSIIFPDTKGLSFPRVDFLVPISELKVILLGREFQVKDENTFISCGYYNDEDDYQSEIELKVWDMPYIKIDAQKISLKMSKNSTPYSGGMSFSILNVGGIGLGLAYTNTNMPTRFYVQPVRAHKRINLSIFKRVKTITETKNHSFETIHYEFQ